MATYDREPRLPLTRMENLVLQCVFSGLSSNRTATQLYLSRRTVDWHLYFAYRKLGATNRAGARCRAQEKNALRPLTEEEAALVGGKAAIQRAALVGALADAPVSGNC